MRLLYSTLLYSTLLYCFLCLSLSILFVLGFMFSSEFWLSLCMGWISSSLFFLWSFMAFLLLIRLPQIVEQNLAWNVLGLGI